MNPPGQNNQINPELQTNYDKRIRINKFVPANSNGVEPSLY